MTTLSLREVPGAPGVPGKNGYVSDLECNETKEESCCLGMRKLVRS